jgi:RNA polymerase sigma factor (sigma-70 family)
MTTEIADEAATPAAGPSDADLITAVRAGDTEAFGKLYSRHKDAARRLARSLVQNSTDVDDLVAETFAKMLNKLKDGGGPDAAFRTYLLTALRNTFYDRTRRSGRIEVTDDVARHDPGVPFVDTAVEGLERSLAARAFARLPERLQMVLWHTEVEGETAAEVAPLLSLTPNGVSALAYRARERLRQAYLQEHLTDSAGDDCGWTIERLGAHVRGGLSNRESGKVRAHLSDCQRCRTLYADLGEVNSGLRGILAPLVLGGAAAGYLATGGKAALSLASFWGGARRTLTTWTGQMAVAGGGVAAATVVAIAVSPHVSSLKSPSDTLVAPRPGTSTSAPPGARNPAGRTTSGTPGNPAVPGAPGAPGVSGTPNPSLSPGQQQPGGEPGSPGSGPGSTPAPSPVVAPEDQPGKADVTTRLAPASSLTRGEPGTLVLTLTNNGRAAGTGGAGAAKAGKGPATAKITAEFNLPSGVTLAAPQAGDGWKCTAISTGAVCRHPSVPAGQSTTARVQVTVAANAADGVPRAIITSNNIGSRTVQSSGGVTGGPGVASTGTSSATPEPGRVDPA